MKRRLFKLALFLILGTMFLVLGAVVNVAVAWGVANILGERTVVTVTYGSPPVTSKHYWPIEEVQGWPMRSLREQVPIDEYSSTVTVIEFKNAKLAVGPIWTGFAINTIFYAVILWLPFTAFKLRRYLRAKRGRCIKCGYDLRETSGGCPECGWGREADA